MTALDDALRGDQLQPAWFIWIDSSPVARAWTGPNTFKMGPSGPDATGGEYIGLGAVATIPSLKVPINGAASVHEFALSGVSADIVRLVEADRATLRGAKMAVARLELAPDGTPIGDPLWVWFGRVDSPKMTRQGGNPVTYTVSIIATAGMASRKRQQLSFFTGVQQRMRDANDCSCDGVSQLQAGTEPIWPS